MFRVDPAFKRAAVFAHIQGKAVEDYHFLQLTGPLPVWIVHSGEEYRERYWFSYLTHALDACQELRDAELYVMLPEHMSATKKLTTSQVTGIYECRRGNRSERRFEVATECGTYRLDEFGFVVRKTLREKSVFTT